MKLPLIFMIILIIVSCPNTQNNDDSEEYELVFSDEEKVELQNYTGSSMEPFISDNNSVLFFNSLNDGIDTSIYYAVKNNYKSFNVIGKVANVNGVQPHLDAVPSADKNNNFYFISTRNYANSYENIYTGSYSNGSVSGLSPVSGNLYIKSPGYIVMDAEINYEGTTLFFVNSYFVNNTLTSSKIGMAHRSGNCFLRDKNESEILGNINNADFFVYAPSISKDQIELYFTRADAKTGKVEICVSSRNLLTGIFSIPTKIPADGTMTEAVSITKDMTRVYYHKKTSSGDYSIYTMKRSRKLKN